MFNNLSIKSQLVLVISLLALLVVAIGGFGLFGMTRANNGLNTVFEDRVVPLGQIAEIQRLTTHNLFDVNTALAAPNAEVIGKHTADIEANIAKIAKVWEVYMATSLTKEEEILAKKFTEDRKAFVEKGLLPAIKALRANDLKEATRLSTEVLGPLSKPVGAGSEALTKLQVDVAKTEYDQAQSRYATIRNTSIAAIIFGVLLAAFIGFYLIRSLLGRLGGEPSEAAAVANRVAAGDLSKDISLRRGDTSSVMAAMARMQEGLKAFVAAQKEIAQQHDAGTISYRIPADKFSGSYREMAEGINNLVASHIAVKMQVVDVVSRYAKGDLTVDMDRLPGEKAKITDAIDGVKSSLQSINGDIAALVAAAQAGDFTVRGDAAKYQHDFKEMVEGLNNLMRISDTGLNEVVRVLGALANGDLTEKITNDYQGTFGRLKDDSNMTVEKLSE
ncbi:MAG: Tar ligand binding domain-containing protein, partial [Usitatibacteraceae bacterium]